MIAKHKPYERSGDPTFLKKRFGWLASLKTKLILVFLLVSIVPLALVGLYTFNQARQSLQDGAQNKLEAIRSSKASQIEQYFEDVERDIRSVARLEVLNEAHRTLSAAASRIVGLETLHQSDFLGNPDLKASESFNAYSLSHNENYDLLANITQAGGYADLMLVNSINGDIIYTYAKNDDFATNLVDGPYSDTHLAEMVQTMMEENDKDKIYKTDFQPYAALNAPVSFIGKFLDNEQVRTQGILIYQLPIENIDEVMASRIGLEETQTGETYLVGSDGLMRSNSPVIKEATGEDTFFTEKWQVDNAAVENGLNGESGFIPSLVNYRGATVFSAYEPINQDDFQWVLIAEIEEDEALQAAADLRKGMSLIVIVVAIVTAGLGLYVAFRISNRIGHLTQAARQVIEGNLQVEAVVESSDETGELAESFNMMTGQLRELIGSLEKQVAERTERLETVVSISRRLAGILELSELMQQVVVLIKERFNYYHVHIYLVDESGTQLVIAEGYGDIGASLKRREHAIPLDASQGLMARAARERQIVVVEDVEQDPNWLPNDLLPYTQSEIAVPIMSGAEVMGVLDVQSDKEHGLTGEDSSVLWALANQVAVAVRNARAFAETQEALNEAHKLQRLYTGQAWERFSTTRPTTDYEIRQAVLPPLGQITTPEALTAIQHQQTVGLRIGSSGEMDEGAGDGHHTGDISGPAVETAMATPLKIGEEVIGVLGIRDDNPDRRWTEEEIALIEAVSEQMSLAIENARLFEETGRRAGRERVIADVTRRIWASSELEQVMQTTVEELGKTLDASKVVIRLGTEDRLIPVPEAGNDDQDNVS